MYSIIAVILSILFFVPNSKVFLKFFFKKDVYNALHNDEAGLFQFTKFFFLVYEYLVLQMNVNLYGLFFKIHIPDYIDFKNNLIDYIILMFIRKILHLMMYSLLSRHLCIHFQIRLLCVCLSSIKHIILVLIRY